MIESVSLKITATIMLPLNTYNVHNCKFHITILRYNELDCLPLLFGPESLNYRKVLMYLKYLIPMFEHSNALLIVTNDSLPN